MRISSPIATAPQASLFPEHDDRALLSPASIRHHVGTWCQDLVHAVTGAQPHVVDATADCCPDLSHPGGTVLEVKSLAGGKESILFVHRLAHDRQLVRQTGRPLVYAYVIHRAPVLTARTLFELRAMLAQGVSGLLFVPLQRLLRAARRQPQVSLCYRADGERMPCYRLAGGLIRTLAAGPTSLIRSIEVHGHPCTITIDGPDIGQALAPMTDAQRHTAGELLAELSEHRLDVSLVPAPRPRFTGHCIRVVQDGNPSWYSRLCASYTKRRSAPRRGLKPDTDIRRPFVERSLSRLSQGICRYEYDWRLRPIVERATPNKATA
jgi:hypothetical protein